MTKLQKLERIRAILCFVDEESPVDFLGTGSDTRWADKEEREWRETIAEGVRLTDELAASFKNDAERGRKNREAREMQREVEKLTAGGHRVHAKGRK